MSDPFAVTRYDPGSLPPVVEQERNRRFFTRGDGEPGFADVWLAYENQRMDLPRFTPTGQNPPKIQLVLDVVDPIVCSILAAYEPGRWAFFDPFRVGMAADNKIAVGPEQMQTIMLPDPQLRDLQSRHLALATVIDHQALQGQRLHRPLQRALMLALHLETPVRKRAEAAKAAAIEGKALARGAGKTEAIRSVVADLGISHGKAWSHHTLPLSQARREETRAYWSATRPVFPVFTRHHASDAWFVGETDEEQLASADRVAQAVINDLRAAAPKGAAGKRVRLPSFQLRWNVLNLIEGFHRRKRPPSETVRVALDYALGLIDPFGGVRPIPLAGVLERGWFMAAARTEARHDPSLPNLSAEKLLQEMDLLSREDIVPTNVETIRQWKRMPLYVTAVEELRKAN